MRESEQQENSARTRTEGDNARLTVNLTLKPRLGKDNLKVKYGVTKYDLANGFAASESLKTLVPKNTPEYVEKGERYVERIMRALYHFKQCALIGPSGTGKSICEGESVFVEMKGRLTLTTVDQLFERMARSLPTTFDEDGWETVLLSGTGLRVLSMDPLTGTVRWRAPHALARSVYKGDVVDVTTTRMRKIRATPGHSFITYGGQTTAGGVAEGESLPIMRRIPSTGTAPITEVFLRDYLPEARATDAGLVLGGRETIQVPAPPVLSLDQELGWFLGFFVAEGYVGKGFASVYNKDSELIDRCAKLAGSLRLGFTLRNQRGLVELRLFSKAFVSFLSRVSVSRRVGKGKGSQARYKVVPDFIYNAAEEVRIAFLRGYFEGDGWEEEGSELVLGTSSRELAAGLTALWEQLGVFPTLRVKGGDTKAYAVVAARDGAKKMGLELGGTGVTGDARGHVEKIQVTESMLSAAKAAYRRLPDHVRSKPFHKRTVSSLYPVGKMIGLNTLRKIAEALASAELVRAAESDILWDQVKTVAREPYDGWVYDFQVPGTETFAAGFGGVFTHNTHIVYLVAELAGLPLWEINCGLQTSVYDLFGRFVGLGKENWVDGQIVSWCRYGGILYLDEANMMKQDVATRLNPILDTRGHMVLTERDNEIIPRHPHGYVIISMNPYSAEFAGTKPLNAAFRRRMSVWIDFDYLSEGNRVSEDEVDMVAKRSKASAEVSEKIVRVAAEIRRRYKAGDLPYGPSVGDLVNWATLVSDGLGPVAAAEETIVALTSDDSEVQNSVRRVIKMVFGDSKDAAG